MKPFTAWDDFKFSLAVFGLLAFWIGFIVLVVALIVSWL